MTVARTIVHVAQLPFPSQSAPHPAVAAYYRDYAEIYADELEGYFLPKSGLWELPLWVAHLAGMSEALGLEAKFNDLSLCPAEIGRCSDRLLAATSPDEAVLLSPLAQNLDLAMEVCQRLSAARRRPILGGNMVPIIGESRDWVLHRGQASLRSLKKSFAEAGVDLCGETTQDYRPSYAQLEGYKGAVPLLRLNASHGCLHNCQFCGDAWSRSLHVVPRAVLEHELNEFERLFPETRLIYIGDKTFGQSQIAVHNLLRLFRERRRYRFVVQTHVLTITDSLLDQMAELGVAVVELGFESASLELLHDNRKTYRSRRAFREVVRRLSSRGFKVVLNILSGLPGERPEDHQATCDFIGEVSGDAWLFNLYNFVPYPMTPLFHRIRAQIVDWKFANWREDAPPIFEPDFVSREESFQFFLEKVATAHRSIQRRLRTTSNCFAAEAVAAE